MTHTWYPVPYYLGLMLQVDQELPNSVISYQPHVQARELVGNISLSNQSRYDGNQSLMMIFLQGTPVGLFRRVVLNLPIVATL